MTVKICLIGAGRAGMVDAKNFEFNVENSSVTAVIDVSEQNAKEAAQKLRAEYYYTDLDKALEEGDFDVVCIGAPTFAHSGAVIKSANAGKDIFCEKPLTITLEEANEMKEAINKNNVKFQIGFMRRFDKNFLRAQEIIEKGNIGEPLLIKSVGRGPGLPPEWYADLNKSNGLLAEVNSHDFDSMMWLAKSNIKEVYAKGDNFKTPQYEEEYPDFYDVATVNLEFDNGMLGLVDGACPATYGYDARMEILGSEGMLQIGTKQSHSVLTWNKDSKLVRDGNESWRILFKDAYLKEAKHFIDCIINDKEPKVGIEAGKEAVKVVVAANESIKNGEPVNL